MDHKICCPRNYVGPNTNLTYQQNLFETFNDYINLSFLPGCFITNVVPLDGNVIPLCAWQIFFTYVPTVQNGSFKRIKLVLEQNKPRNSILRSVRMLGVHNYCVEYSVACDCKALDFCSIDETYHKVNPTALDVIKDIEAFQRSFKLEALKELLSINTRTLDKVTEPKSIECGFFKVVQCDDKCEMAHLTIEYSADKRGLYADLRDEYDGRDGSCATKLALESHMKRIFSLSVDDGPNKINDFDDK